MATKIAGGTVISFGTVVQGVDADSPPLILDPVVPQPEPEPEPEPSPEPAPQEKPEGYTLSASASPTNEGTTVTITLSTTEVAAGTKVPYVISGIVRADIGGAPLVGAFTVGESESIDLNITADELTEGAETLTLALSNGEASTNVEITDTSVTPVVFEGVLDAGEDRSVIEGAGASFEFNATLSTYNPATDTILWEQLSGDTGTFSSTNSLSTTFTTATDATQTVSLRISVTRVIGAITLVATDTVAVNLDPGQTISSGTEVSSIVGIDTRFYVSSMLASMTNENTNLDSIIWSVPEGFNGWSYYGYKIESWNKDIEDWSTVISTQDNTTSFYQVSDVTAVYRYVPLWLKNGLVIQGKSVKFLKSSIQGDLGVAENIQIDPIVYTSKVSTATVQKFTKTIVGISGTVDATDPREMSSDLEVTSVDRSLKTKTDTSLTDDIGNYDFANTSQVSNVSITRFQSSLVQI